MVTGVVSVMVWVETWMRALAGVRKHPPGYSILASMYHSIMLLYRRRDMDMMLWHEKAGA